MVEQARRVLVEFVQANEPDLDQALTQRLAVAVGELGLAPTFLEHLRTALAEAARRTWREHDGHAAHAAVSVRVTVAQAAPDGDPGAVNWGFFLVDKSGERSARHTLELFLYQDKR